ncbi:MAG TPA: VOC family protein [Ilumatobacteraceae bacterium]|nr:VOC family protein [Ilumatobacteraceae bacterium]
MVEQITPSKFHSRSDLPEWRVVLGRIEAAFHAPTFEEAAALISRIASAAEAAGHHPDLDLRYPSDVFVRLTTHATGGLTDADASLAAAVSALAADAGATSEPAVAVGLEVAIDALDIDAVRPFWKAVLGYDEVPNEGGTIFFLTDPRRVGPDFWFQQMEAPRPQRNRIHIDVSVPHDVAEQRVADAIAAGGHVVSDKRARAFWILADAEGNEACICTWQDRN